MIIDLVILLFIAWLGLSLVHFGVPLLYFAGVRRRAYKKSYGLNPVQYGMPNPSVTIIVPTYNESGVIRRKLENIAGSDYPREKMEIVVVDGGSTDDTAEQAWRFFKTGRLKGLVLEETERRGKSAGLNRGLKQASGDLVCFSDAECEWETDALRNAVKYFSDPAIGTVSGVHMEKPDSKRPLSVEVEGSYRSIYRMLRISESKIHSTPVAEGELQLFRTREMPGFDTSIGGDDTCAALCMVEKGFRAISAADVVFYEPTPSSWKIRFRQKVRRGQHVMQAFLRHKSLLWRKNTVFSRFVFPMEFFLYLVNPLLFPFFVATTIVLGLVSFPFAVFVIVSLFIIVFTPLSKVAVTEVTNNLVMLAAFVQELRGKKQLVWDKIEENRAATPEQAPILVSAR